MGSRLRNWVRGPGFPPFVAALLGLGWFIWIGGGPAIPPWRLDWLMSSDWSTHVLGWLMYRNASWSFPLGSLDNLLSPVGSSVGYTDSIPWIAFVGKIASGVLPVDFQYIGLWLAACFALQGYFGARLVSIVSSSRLQQIAGGFFFALAPTLARRLAHDSLCAHWLLLASIWMNLKEYPDQAAVRRGLSIAGILIAFSSGVHPYLAAMIVATTAAMVVRLRFVDRVLSWPVFGVAMIGGPAIAMIVFLLFGYVGGPIAIGEGGFGFFSADLNAFFNPVGWSRFLNDRPVGGGSHEGFAYLGLGVLALAVVGLAGYFVRSLGRPPRALLRVAPLAVVAIGLAFFSLSQEVKLGGALVADLSGFYKPLMKVVEPFRSSGRFIWPLHYLVMSMVLLVTAWAWRTTPRIAGGLIALAVAVQIADVNPAYATNSLTPKPFRRLSSEGWDLLAQKHRRLAVVPMQVWGRCSGAFEHDRVIRLAYRSYLSRQAFNSGYVARLDVKGIEAACAQLMADVGAGKLDPEVAYLPSAAELPRLLAGGATCGLIDDEVVCVREPGEPLRQFLAGHPL